MLFLVDDAMQEAVAVELKKLWLDTNVLHTGQVDPFVKLAERGLHAETRQLDQLQKRAVSSRSLGLPG